MAMDPALRAAYDAFKTVESKAAQELLNLQKTYEGQADLLSEFLGRGVDEAANRLAELESKGTDAIPDGLRQDVIDAYNKVAQIIKDAPSELQPLVDPNGTQAARADLTARAAQLMEGSGAATAGTAGLTAWLTSLSTATAGALIAVSLAIIVGGLYLAFKHSPATPASGLDGSGFGGEVIVTDFTFMGAPAQTQIVPFYVFPIELKFVNVPSGLLALFDAEGKTLTWANGLHGGELNVSVPPGVYSIRFYKGGLCCDYEGDTAPWIAYNEEGALALKNQVDRTGQTQDLAAAPFTASFTLSVKNGLTTFVTDDPSRFIRKN